MNDDSDRILGDSEAYEADCEAYEAPQLEILGSVSELTTMAISGFSTDLPGTGSQ
jgi:hypothetical protein